MKKMTWMVFILMISFTWAAAQDEEENFKTLFGSIESHGGYGGISVGYSQIDNRDALVIGGRAAWIINHQLALGVAGTAFLNEYEYDSFLAEDVNLQGGYGGLMIEPILGGQEWVHLSFPIVVGAGGIVHAEKYVHRNRYDYDYRDDYVNDTDAFFLLEPGAELEFNMFRFLRVSMGAYYRYTDNIDLYDTDEDVLRGFSYQLTFKIGKF
ncbi:MAG: hypothetical protein KGY70_13260 [Bacteroidales bacterium]|nr:hypothetical protein [Bacteroidales bacterium]